MEWKEFIRHEGVAWDENPPGRGSGRYAHGSGDNPYQHDNTFLGRYNRYRAQGLTAKEIADKLGCYDVYGKATDKALRARVSREKASVKEGQRVKALKLYEEGNKIVKLLKHNGLLIHCVTLEIADEILHFIYSVTIFTSKKSTFC